MKTGKCPNGCGKKLQAAESRFHRRILKIPWIKQQGILKEYGNRVNTYTKTQEKVDEIPWRHNTEKAFGKLNHHGPYLGKER